MDSNCSYSNNIFDCDNGNNTSNDADHQNIKVIMKVVTCVIMCAGLPLTLVSIYAVCSLVRSDHVAPIYVINLLVSDLIQFCCMIMQLAPVTESNIKDIFSIIYCFGLMASVGFMTCVALERYLVIAFPLWYRCRRTLKTSVLVCVVVWSFPPVFLLICYFWVPLEARQIILTTFLLLPFPLLIFFLCGILKALSASRVPADEKRRIVGTLVLVLLTYMLLFLPSILWLLTGGAIFNITYLHVSIMLLQLSPLADLVLYIFMRKGRIDKLLASVCCCRMDNNNVSTTSSTA